uniref:Methyltransf_2 domain-containing protein n=1 Tax=Heligmosomoides polygyrus TaxID=6339 RepID=A0A183GSR1_HELPZ
LWLHVVTFTLRHAASRPQWGRGSQHDRSEMDETLSPALCATDKNGLLLEVMKHEADQFSEVVGSSKVTFFFNETYERVLKKAGFTKVEFLNPVISAEGLELYGEEFFRSYLNPPKDIILRAYKL